MFKAKGDIIFKPAILILSYIYLAISFAYADTGKSTEAVGVKTDILDDFAVVVDTAKPPALAPEFKNFALSFCSSDKIKLYGEQDGRFPNFGPLDTVKNEEGGGWGALAKFFDGYWLAVEDKKTATLKERKRRLKKKGKEGKWLTQARTFVNLPYGNKQLYTRGPLI